MPLPTALDEARLIEICQQGVDESQTLDFKQILPGTTDQDKAEFLKDVCAFANAQGGDLIYGIAERGGKARALLPITSELADAAIRRLGQVLDSGLEPRLVGHGIQHVPVTGGYALRVRVPASFNGPHRYVFKGGSKFVVRNGTHTTELSYAQLRSAFDRTATLAERARSFRQERIALINGGDTWRPMTAGPIAVVHLIPIAAMAGDQLVDIRALYDDYRDFAPVDWQGGSRTTNLEGLAIHPGGGQGQLPFYAQVFRSGALETLRFAGRVQEPTKVIPSRAIGDFVRKSIGRFFTNASKLNISGPAFVGVALLRLSGHEFGTSAQPRPKADRDHYVFPESWVEDLGSPPPFDEVARPILDMMWQSFGVERCYDYGEDGRWLLRSE